MSGVDNMEYMYSLNANNGQTTLTVDFNVTTDASTDQILTQMRQSQADRRAHLSDLAASAETKENAMRTAASTFSATSCSVTCLK